MLVGSARRAGVSSIPIEANPEPPPGFDPGRFFSSAGTRRGTGSRSERSPGDYRTHVGAHRNEKGAVKTAPRLPPGEDWKPFRNRGLDHFLHDCAGN